MGWTQEERQPLLAGEIDIAAAALPAVLLILHPEEPGSQAAVVPQLGAKKLAKCLKVLRRHPVIPLLLELPLCVMRPLQASAAILAQGVFIRSLESHFQFGFEPYYYLKYVRDS